MLLVDTSAAVETEVQATVDRLTTEITGVQILAEEVEDRVNPLGLMQVDRATRMILLRIPGLREALRVLYAIKMLERTLRLGEMRGPITAALASIIYLSMFLTQIQRRQDRLEAEMRTLEQDMELRLITIEEAVKGYSELPQHYRSTVIS